MHGFAAASVGFDSPSARRVVAFRPRLAGVLVWLVALAAAGAPPRAVAEGLRILSPVERQVIQRHSRSDGVVPVVVAGDVAAGTRVEARVMVAPDAPWHPLERDGDRFVGAIPAPAGGPYALQIRRSGEAEPVAVVSRVGVGEVFVVAGQSNSANHGEVRLAPKCDRVSTLAPDGTWRVAADPQPGASGDAGSFQPPLGDLLVERYDVPVGFVCCGIGATSVREWLPAGIPFPNPPTLVGRVKERPDRSWVSDGAAFTTLVARMRQCGPEGFRAVLWHQGESDANQADPSRTLPGPLYEAQLSRVITASRDAIDRDVPWFVARATYHVPGDESSPAIRAAQNALVRDGLALAGPDTDLLGAPFRDGGGKGVHFSGPGLVRHAEAWFDSLAPWLDECLGPR